MSEEWSIDDVVIRAERLDDADAITAVITDAFQSPIEARLANAIRESPNFVPEWSLVAELRDRIVGHTMVSYVALVDEQVTHHIPSLSPMSVATDFQRCGVGSALIRAVVARVDEAGEPMVVLEGAPAYYGRLGFEYAMPHGIHITLPEWAPPEAAQIMRLRAYDPTIRGHLVYPPAFDNLDH